MSKDLWTDDEYLITMYLYRFGYDDLGLNYTQIAEIIGRTPDSIIYRFANYLSVENGKTGLNGGGNRVHEMFNKYINCSKDEMRKNVITALLRFSHKK